MSSLEEEQDVPKPPKKSGRGRYVRSNDVGKRVKWSEHVQDHMRKLQSGHLLGGIKCSPTCRNQNCNEFVDLRLAKLCAEESFGFAALKGDWSNIQNNHKAVRHWFDLVYAQRVLHSIHKTVVQVDYKLHGVSVCARAWAGFYGIPETTAATIHRQVMQNKDVWNDGLAKQCMLAKRKERAYLEQAAAAWWYIRLGYYEMIVDYGFIQYPRDICWTSVYEDEFVPEVRKLGYHWKQPHCDVDQDNARHDNDMFRTVRGRGGPHASRDHDYRDGLLSDDELGNQHPLHAEDDSKEHGSISTWYRGRNLALKQLAHDKLGENAKPFKFVSRAKHSAYVSCKHMLSLHSSYVAPREYLLFLIPACRKSVTSAKQTDC